MLNYSKCLLNNLFKLFKIFIVIILIKFVLQKNISKLCLTKYVSQLLMKGRKQQHLCCVHWYNQRAFGSLLR